MLSKWRTADPLTTSTPTLLSSFILPLLSSFYGGGGDTPRPIRSQRPLTSHARTICLRYVHVCFYPTQELMSAALAPAQSCSDFQITTWWSYSSNHTPNAHSRRSVCHCAAGEPGGMQSGGRGEEGDICQETVAEINSYCSSCCGNVIVKMDWGFLLVIQLHPQPNPCNHPQNRDRGS